MSKDKKTRAILLIGPTGSGKTPLGNYLEENGLWQKKCFHFDFGKSLRQIADHNTPDDTFSQKEISFIQSVLESGALIENEHFDIAKKILNSFIKDKKINGDDLIILNGVPRHIGQAKNVDKTVKIEMIIYLECSTDAVRKRIQTNVGGDRSERIDDSIESIKRKWDVFMERTMPLLDYYRSKGVRIANIEIGIDTNPQEIWETLNQ